MTNRELGDLIGCTHSMASRLRAGKRLPGFEIMNRICEVFGIDWDQLVAARNQGQEAFGALLRDLVQQHLDQRSAA